MLNLENILTQPEIDRLKKTHDLITPSKVKAERNYYLNSAAEIKYGKLTIQKAHLEKMEIELKKVKGI